MNSLVDDVFKPGHESKFASGSGTPKFDFINDGGWFENPFGDPTTYANLERDLTQEVPSLEDFVVDDSNNFFYGDSYGGSAFDDKDAVPIQDVEDLEISQEETGEPEGCKNIKIASLVMGIVVAFLIVWLIISIYLSTSKPVCKKETEYCSPCPVCPSSYGVTTLQFYIRDRISMHSMFVARLTQVYSQQGEDGTLFVYDPDEETIRVQPDNLYLYAPVDGGVLSTSAYPFDEPMNGYTRKFVCSWADRTMRTDSGHYVIVDSGILLCIEPEVYKTTPYLQKIAMFKENPNLKLSFY